MILCEVLIYAAWLVSGGLLLWIVVDAVKVSRVFEQELLIRTHEAADGALKQMQKGESLK